MLRVTDLHVGYGAIRALKGVSLEVNDGEVVTLIGANGAGKSTLLRTISGVLRPTMGDITFEDRSIRGLAEDRIVRMGLLQVQEGRGILVRMTVQENLEMGAYCRSDRAGVRRDMEMIFEKFPVLRQRRRQFGATLSGGEQQMLAIGRALMSEPKMLLLDEPSMGLAPLIVKLIGEVITNINHELGTTVFLSEQNANMALNITKRGYVMENGRCVLSGECCDLKEDEKVRKAYIGA
jgi:branched-chain amino acid transport system ATP-binding protein